MGANTKSDMDSIHSLRNTLKSIIFWETFFVFFPHPKSHVITHTSKLWYSSIVILDVYNLTCSVQGAKFNDLQ